MDNPDIAQDLVKCLHRTDGDLSKRPGHTIGNRILHSGAGCQPLLYRATFSGCIGGSAGHLRFSNGSGCAVVHDGWSDVRGMATRFDLGPEGATDLIAMNLSEFFTPMPETF